MTKRKMSDKQLTAIRESKIHHKVWEAGYRYGYVDGMKQARKIFFDALDKYATNKE